MSCKYKNKCPSYSGWCEAPKIDFAKCIPFLITAYENAKQEQKGYKALEESGRLVKLPCAIGDPLYWISPEDDDGNEIETVKDCQGGVRAFVVTAHEIRVADKDQALELVMDSTEPGTQYAYLSREAAEAALEGAGK